MENNIFFYEELARSYQNYYVYCKYTIVIVALACAFDLPVGLQFRSKFLILEFGICQLLAQDHISIDKTIFKNLFLNSFISYVQNMLNYQFKYRPNNVSFLKILQLLNPQTIFPFLSKRFNAFCKKSLLYSSKGS